MMEEIIYGDDVFKIPSGLCDDFSVLLDIISPDTWNNILTDEHREMLMKYLPDFPQDDLNEKTHTLEMFFMNENFYFGSPLQNFFHNLKRGFYNPHVTKLRKIQRKILKRTYKYRQKKYVHNLLEEILVKRREMLEEIKDKGYDNEGNFVCHPYSNTKVSRRELCMRRAQKRYYKEIQAVKAEAGCDSDLSDDDNYPEGMGLTLNKKQRRQLFLLEASFPTNLCPIRSTLTKGSLALDIEANLTSTRNPFDSSDDHFKNLLSNHLAHQKKRKSLKYDTRGITLKSILERAETLTKKPVQRPQQQTHSSSPVLPPRLPLAALPSNSVKKTPNKKKSKLLTTSLNNENVVHIPLDVTTIKKELSSDSLSSDGETTTTTTNHDTDVMAKDGFCASPASSTLEDVRHSITAELTQETHLSFFSLLRDIFCSTANQRMGKPQIISSISTWQDSAISPLNEWFCFKYLLPDFVPFIEYKNTLKYFQWIGAGRDSDANLEPLCQYWLSNRDNIPCIWPKDGVFVGIEVEDRKPPLPLQVKGTTVTTSQPLNNWSLKLASPIEEGLPKSEYHEQERRLWDAVARLPNSEGTKVDICELLKESQFLVPINSQSLENTLNNVVSGALDRLQNEKDPCVKFDTSRKLWVYLHKSRSEKELEMMHQLKLRSGSNKSKSSSSSSSSRKSSSKKKEESALNQGPPNVSLEQYSPAIKANLDNAVIVASSESLSEFTTPTIMQSACIAEEPKVNATILQSNPSTSTSLNAEAVKLQIHAQNSKKYSSSAEKKKSVKQESLTSSPGKTATTTNTTTTMVTTGVTTITPTKLYHTQPVATSTVLTQNKGIKLLQYTNPSIQAKGVVGNASLVVDTSTALPAALVGQKLVVAGNRVLVQGGKVLHNVSAANVAGRTKQVLAGVLPAQHIMAVNKKQTGGEQHTVEGGRFIQIATVDPSTGFQKQGGYQKLTLVPQFTQATISSAGQKVQEATGATLGAIAKGELKLKLGSTAFATTSGNIISLGGKQILLTTKGSPTNRTAQIHQIVLPAGTTGQQVTGVSSSSTSSHGTTVTTTGKAVVAHLATAGASQSPKLTFQLTDASNIEKEKN
ncbi:Nuclear factor related to kappa-B-binding protein [Armadillidium vulgare]|nr:Nuclear factor related to kappa-B-binding protein [Armadillidium vulgare]